MNQDTDKKGAVYYVIPDQKNKNFSVLPFLRSLKKGNAREHIREHWLVQHKPVGGIKVYYQHCMILNELGVSASPLLLGKYHGNFFNYPVDTQHIDEVSYNLTPQDSVIIPEYTPYLGQQFSQAKKIVFVQNKPYKNRKLGEENKSFAQMGYDEVWYCSQYIKTLLNDDDIAISHYIPNYIDLDKFIPNKVARINHRVMAMPRKNIDDLNSIQRHVNHTSADFFLADGLTEDQLIAEYQQADVFLATGYPEGFGLPPLEAMACGCAVVGFTGGGALEFMSHEQTALVAEDGDTATASQLLERILSDAHLKESLREQGFSVAQRYNKQNTLQALATYFGVKTHH